jgi:rRNA maturation endonuclease Nob1
MVDIADTSALLAWPAERVSSALAVPSQMAEVEKLSPERAMLYQAQGPEWATPSPQSLAEAKTAAAMTGDLPRLSSVDIELLALALEKQAVLHTDDYRIQNVATSAGIEWRSVTQSGISKGWDWELRCTGCRQRTPTIPDDSGSKNVSDCDVCGSPQELKRKRRR